MRRRWQPSGWAGSTAGCSGSRAANWSQSGSISHDGRTGTGLLSDHRASQLHDHRDLCPPCRRGSLHCRLSVRALSQPGVVHRNGRQEQGPRTAPGGPAAVSSHPRRGRTTAHADQRYTGVWGRRSVARRRVMVCCRRGLTPMRRKSVPWRRAVRRAASRARRPAASQKERPTTSSSR